MLKGSNYTDNDYFLLNIDELCLKEEVKAIDPLIRFIINGNERTKVKAIKAIREIIYLHEDECYRVVPYLISAFNNKDNLLRREVLKTINNFNLKDEELLVFSQICLWEEDKDNLTLIKKILGKYFIDKKDTVSTNNYNDEDEEEIDIIQSDISTDNTYEKFFNVFVAAIIMYGESDEFYEEDETISVFSISICEDEEYYLYYIKDEDRVVLSVGDFFEPEFELSCTRDDDSQISEIIRELIAYGFEHLVGY